MKIAVDYTNGRIKEFDLTIFTNNDAIRNGERASKNVTTELDLRLDRIEQDGLRLDLFWHDLAKAEQKVELDGVRDQNNNTMSAPEARKRVATSVKLLTPKELEGAARIIVERAQERLLVAWRQGSNKWLINGLLFDIQRQLMYSDANTISINRQAYKTFQALRKQADSSITDAEVAESMGYPYEAYLEVLKQEYIEAVETGEETNNLMEDGFMPDELPDIPEEHLNDQEALPEVPNQATTENEIPGREDLAEDSADDDDSIFNV